MCGEHGMVCCVIWYVMVLYFMVWCVVWWYDMVMYAMIWCFVFIIMYHMNCF